MWRLELASGMTPEEAEYYNRHILIIVNYYRVNADFWQSRDYVKYGSSRVKK